MFILIQICNLITDEMAESKQTAEKRTPDAEYLKSEGIGLVIAKGMAVLYKEQPRNPVDFLSKWLFNHAHVERAAEAQKEAENAVLAEKKAHNEACKKQEAEEKQAAEKAQARSDEISNFHKELAECPDLNDKLQSLTEHLKDFTGATSTYIGHLVRPKKPIKDSDNDTAHIDLDAEHVVHYYHADEAHKYIVDSHLKKEQGLTFDVFNDPEPSAKEEAEPEVDEDGNPIVKEKPVVEKLPHHVVVPEVVREPRIHFFKVPRLGSYMAIRLEYESCLFEEAFDAGIEDMNRVREERAKFAEEIEAFN